MDMQSANGDGGVDSARGEAENTASKWPSGARVTCGVRKWRSVNQRDGEKWEWSEHDSEKCESDIKRHGTSENSVEWFGKWEGGLLVTQYDVEGEKNDVEMTQRVLSRAKVTSSVTQSDSENEKVMWMWLSVARRVSQSEQVTVM